MGNFQAQCLFSYESIWILTAIWISLLAMLRSCSLFTNNLFSAYFSLADFTRKTTANPPERKQEMGIEQITSESIVLEYLLAF